MTARVNACVPVVYVTDVAASVAFYDLFGLAVQVQGEDGDWRWAYLKSDEIGLLIASGPMVRVAAVPVHLYLRTDDVDGLVRNLSGGGVETEHLGYPDHAPGGEIKVLDPDGHVLLVGQVTGAPSVRESAQSEERSSILARAAAAAKARGVAPQRCQFPIGGGRVCPKPAEVKLADSWGDSAWTCLEHAEDTLINAKGAFIAAEDSEGLATFLRRRQHVTPDDV
jgi:catechol 2,3-dioxygenase-like lactoylglutathione lyase family enzyme